MKTIIRTLALGAFVLGAGTVDGQTPRTGRLMREKLTHAQKVLEALTTSNQELLLSESAALERITHSPRWDELRMTELQTIPTPSSKPSTSRTPPRGGANSRRPRPGPRHDDGLRAVPSATERHAHRSLTARVRLDVVPRTMCSSASACAAEAPIDRVVARAAVWPRPPARDT